MVSDTQESMLEIIEGAQLPLTINIEVTIAADSDGNATIAFPPELRLSEKLVRHLAQSLGERGLIIKHWRCSPEQQAELEGLPNVVVQGELVVPKEEAGT